MPTGFAYSDYFLLHNDQPRIPHFESSDRLIACLDRLSRNNLFPTFYKPDIKPISIEMLSLVHTEYHIQKVQDSAGRRGYFDGDTPFTEDSWLSAFYAAGSGIALVDALVEGKIQNGFSLLRPPGHHAERDRIMGFCMFNNIAVTARYLQINGFKKIFIVDWDVHHGNGTQEIFYSDPDVFYASIHQYPFYPMTGSFDETGFGLGKGTTLNVPMPADSHNSAYIKAFEKKIIPAIEQFRPEVILISAGFDAHKRDPLGGMKVTTLGFEKISDMVLAAAYHICEGRVLSFLEGGYDKDTLAECVDVHLTVLDSFS
ncbi:histone deacetylase [Leptospira gomenensis]|uniref:Histone deacetylase n=1 Tax=Leptospira gomenensis TaxID=2484974 RepID=A0A5F1Y8L4_9LEPT|nr:histone deacetylase [Leptospira gomenensis]TGK29490.1 histone deacetylase [Leptospira gomenensis]TGK44848.1 histone deacetylase [Leptospira gomenensis]TGK64467.1 histone deacetylase [Leptospira gomenensis]